MRMDCSKGDRASAASRHQTEKLGRVGWCVDRRASLHNHALTAATGPEQGSACEIVADK